MRYLGGQLVKALDFVGLLDRAQPLIRFFEPKVGDDRSCRSGLGPGGEWMVDMGRRV